MEELRVVSVNIGEAESIQRHDRDGSTVVTGINKRPVPHSVRVGAAGLEGDAICNEKHHGGVDQAVYAYGVADYEWWSEQLQRRVEYGTFGDNLTIAGLPADMMAGDRLLIGNLILEVTAPRIPCATLAAIMNERDFGIRFRRAERPGFYFRVLNEGELRQGDAVTIVENPQDGVTMLELFRLAYDNSPSPDDLRRALAAPIAERLRRKFESRLGSTEA